ncbi:MAG: hypothetical protein ACO3A4_04120 [Silvanigrellaceae bacterium]
MISMKKVISRLDCLSSLSGMLVVLCVSGCKKGDNASESQSTANSNAQFSILGTWQDQDQLLLVDTDNQTLDPVVGFNLNVNQEVEKASAAKQLKIGSWMILRVKRVFSQNSYTLDANCSTMNGEKTNVSVSAPWTLNEKASSFDLPGDEKSHYAKLGDFDCVASISGHTSRKYAVSADGKQLTLILGSAPEDRIPLMRIAYAQNPVGGVNTPPPSAVGTASPGTSASVTLKPSQETYLKKNPGTSVTGSTGLREGVDYCKIVGEFKVSCVRSSSANEFYVSGATACAGIVSGYLFKPHFPNPGALSVSCP